MPRSTTRAIQKSRRRIESIVPNRQAGASPFLFAPTSHLILPRFDRGVPLKAELPKASSVDFAIALAEADLLKPEDYDPSVEAMVGSVINRMAKDCKIFKQTCYFIDDFEQHEDYQGLEHDRLAGNNGFPGTIPNGMRVGAVYFCSGGPRWFELKHWCEYLEDLHPYLGQTMIALIHNAGCDTFGVLNPIHYFDQVRHMQWGWEDDHTGRQEELYEEELEYLKKNDPAKAKTFKREDVDGLIRLDDILDQVPRWSFEPKASLKRFQRMKFSEVQPKKRAPLHEVFRVEEIFQTAQKLSRMLPLKSKLVNQNDAVPYPSEFSAPIATRWFAEDIWGRIMDEAYEYECNGGENHDISAAYFFPWGDWESLKKIFFGLQEIFNVQACLEHLITLIGEPIK